MDAKEQAVNSKDQAGDESPLRRALNKVQEINVEAGINFLNKAREHLTELKRCCTVCDAKKRCSVCKQQTLYACSDCAIDLDAAVYVCAIAECRKAHDEKCPAVLRDRIAAALESRSRDCVSAFDAEIARQAEFGMYPSADDFRIALRNCGPQDELSAALNELREIWPDDEFTIDFASRPDNWTQVSIFRFASPVPMNTILVSQGATLPEAIQKVREWHQEQSKGERR